MSTHAHIFKHSDPVVTLLGSDHRSTGSTKDSYCHGNQELASLDTTVSSSSAALFSSSPLLLFGLPLFPLTPHLMFPHSCLTVLSSPLLFSSVCFSSQLIAIHSVYFSSSTSPDMLVMNLRTTVTLTASFCDVSALSCCLVLNKSIRINRDPQ